MNFKKKKKEEVQSIKNQNKGKPFTIIIVNNKTGEIEFNQDTDAFAGVVNVDTSGKSTTIVCLSYIEASFVTQVSVIKGLTAITEKVSEGLKAHAGDILDTTINDIGKKTNN